MVTPTGSGVSGTLTGGGGGCCCGVSINSLDKFKNNPLLCACFK
jgi:hypothetical protein